MARSKEKRETNGLRLSTGKNLKTEQAFHQVTAGLEPGARRIPGRDFICGTHHHQDMSKGANIQSTINYRLKENH